MKAVRGLYDAGTVRLEVEPGVRGPVPAIVILLNEPAAGRRKGRAPRRVREHPAFGMWAGRSDIQDAARFAENLRDREERRGDER